MNIKLAPTLRHYDKKNLSKDIVAGIIIMAVSIPISMGYAQIAGLPAVYGLYGSVFPILAFALFSTSPQFILGVDAAPAALVGAALLSLNIESGTSEAIAAVGMLTFFVALWLLAFSVLKAGKLVNFISTPVMGGFISGICTTIILMQVPKILGGTAGTGELLELAEHIAETAAHIPCDSAGGKKMDSEIPYGCCSDGGRRGNDRCSATAGNGHSDADSRSAGDAKMGNPGFYGCAIAGSDYYQPFCCCRYYGGDLAGGK